MRIKKRKKTKQNKNLIIGQCQKNMVFKLIRHFIHLAKGIHCVKKSYKFSVISGYLINVRLLRQPLLESKFQARNYMVCNFITNELPHLQVSQLLLFGDLSDIHTLLGSQTTLHTFFPYIFSLKIVIWTFHLSELRILLGS